MTIRAYSFSKYIVPVINTTAVKSCTAEVGLCQGPDASHSEQLQHPNTALPCAVQFLYSGAAQETTTPSQKNFYRPVF